MIQHFFTSIKTTFPEEGAQIEKRNFGYRVVEFLKPCSRAGRLSGCSLSIY